ncbi:MAG: PilZ domain-containing protein [Gammaproteobacteria bacterium]|nr:PilZ domain-containing protein [Gammaproteobacteria bacterium]
MTVEKRQHPRYPRRVTVTVAGHELYTTTISVGGAQVECAAMRFPALTAATAVGAWELCLTLPNEKLPLLVSAARCYADRVDDAYLIGLRFVRWHGYAEERWRGYLDSLTDTYTRGARP